jgi:hypothetical protein
MDARFRNANRYAGIQDFGAGFPNFYEGNYGNGVVHGTLLLHARLLPGLAPAQGLGANDIHRRGAT